MSNFVHRNAQLEDMPAIWALVKQTAADIPVAVDTSADQERALSEIMACCAAELSPVAIDDDKNLVAVVLAKRDLLDWGLFNGGAINVSAIAVAPANRDQGLVKELLEKLIARGAPLYVNVRTGETQGVNAELKSLGFVAAASDAQGELYKWEPQAKAA